MGFRFYRPHRSLQPYIRYYWVFRSSRLQDVLTFPIGCPQLIFHKGDPLYIPESGAFQARMAVSGQVDFPAHLQSDGVTEMLVVVFRPYGMKPFLRIPVQELYNLEIPGQDLGDKGLEELELQVCGCGNTADMCVNMVEGWLLSRLSGYMTAGTEYDMGRVAAAMRLLLAAPWTPVTELASAACLGRKQFGRLFKGLVGASPKKYARIARFQQALKFLQDSPGQMNLAQLAYMCGYADQSQMVREFRQFSGCTPAALLKRSDKIIAIVYFGKIV